MNLSYAYAEEKEIAVHDSRGMYRYEPLTPCANTTNGTCAQLCPPKGSDEANAILWLCGNHSSELARTIGLPCFVTNCGEGLDYKAMSKFFMGLIIIDVRHNAGSVDFVRCTVRSDVIYFRDTFFNFPEYTPPFS